MPELPEVETIRLGLQKYLVGHRIVDVEVLEKRNFHGDPDDVIGSKVTDIKRVGKVLIIELSNGFSMVVHLKMTGQLVYRVSRVSWEGNEKLSEKAGGELPNKFTRVIFKLKSQNSKVKISSKKSKVEYESNLYFNDIRKFGWVKIVKKDEVQNLPFFKDLGAEPFRDLTPENFLDVMKSSNRAIKIVLMDQRKIAGVGNIYANEALFLAKIDPIRPAKSLIDKEVSVLYESVIEVLKRGIKYGGSSDVNYINALGQDGHYQEHFLVYGRKGQKCLNCGAVVQKITLGGRGTYFCPDCQK